MTNCIKCQKEIPQEGAFCMHCGTRQEKTSRKSRRTRGNGLGSVYKLPNGKYRAEVTLGYSAEGKRIYTTKSGFTSKKAALEYLPLLQKGHKEKKCLKFYELFDLWSKKHYNKIGKSKQSSYNTAYKRCEPIYYFDISSISLYDMQGIIDSCPGGYYPKQDIKVLLNKMFSYAIANGDCDTNYATYIELPPLTKSKKTAFNKQEVNAIWSEYENGYEFAGYVLIMIYTGMRYGEISIIEKERIYLDKKHMIGGIKTEAGIDRVIAIADKIFPIVERFYNKNKTKLLEMSEKAFYAEFKNLMKKIGARPELTPHCCRHTFSTIMAEKGIQPAIIKEAAGHANYSTTLGYTHIPLETLLGAVNKL